MSRNRAIRMGLQAAQRLLSKGSNLRGAGAASAPARAQAVTSARGNRVIVPGTAKYRQDARTALGVVTNHARKTSPNQLPLDKRGQVQPLHKELRDSAARVAPRFGITTDQALQDGVAPHFRKAVGAKAGKPVNGSDGFRIKNPKTDGATGGRLGARPDGTLKPSQKTGKRWANNQAAKSVGIKRPKSPNYPSPSTNATTERKVNRRNNPLMIGRTGQARIREDLYRSQIEMSGRNAGRDQYGLSQYDRDMRARINRGR